MRGLTLSVRRMTVLALSVAACMGGAQTFSQDAKYQETYAIVDARIEIGNGQVIDKGTVLVKKGRIAAVGANVQVPSYAYVIKGDKLTVYPGFIDAYSTQYLRLPEWQPNEDVVPDESKMPAVSMREANRNGMRPQIAASSFLDSAMAPYEHRKAGFTTALLVPSGGMFNGSASLVDLSARPARESVLIPQVGMALGFSAPSPSNYPDSQMGVMALIRQTLWDAAAFNGQPNGPDPALGALKPVLSGQTPVFVDAGETYEITRAIRLSDEFKFKTILVGGEQAGKRVSEIKAKAMPVIVSLDWAPEPKPKKQEGKGQTPQPSNVPDEVLNQRQSEWLEIVNSAKKLSESNVPFAFSTRGTRSMSDFLKNVRRCIEEGLPRAAALRALTLEPARLFGADRDLGTVEVGKRANLTIMVGDFAKEDVKVPYMLIDGILFKPETDRAPRPAQPRFNFGEEEEEGHARS